MKNSDDEIQRILGQSNNESSIQNNSISSNNSNVYNNSISDEIGRIIPKTSPFYTFSPVDHINYTDDFNSEKFPINKESQIKFKNTNSINFPNEANNFIGNGKPFINESSFFSLEEILGLEKNNGCNKTNRLHSEEMFNLPNCEFKRYDMMDDWSNQRTNATIENRELQHIENRELQHIENRELQHIENNLLKNGNLNEINSYQSDYFTPIGISPEIVQEYQNTFNHTAIQNTQTPHPSQYINNGYADRESINKHVEYNKINNGGFNASQYRKMPNNESEYNQFFPYNYQMESDSRCNMTNNIKTKDSNIDPLLFRNPIYFQSSFNPAAYNRVKRRRRLNSTTSNYTNTMPVHPSKISSVDYVFGNKTQENEAKHELNVHSNINVNPVKIADGFHEKIGSIDFSNVTVLELKMLMKNFGVNSNGRKQDMIDRLKHKLKDIVKSKNQSPVPNNVKNVKDTLSFDGYFF